MSNVDLKHTPGPWKLECHCVDEPEHGHGIVFSTGGSRRYVNVRDVATIETADMDIPKLEANARLMAAAPDLLEACQRLLATGSFAKNGAEAESAAQFATAAIAKALSR